VHPARISVRQLVPSSQNWKYCSRRPVTESVQF
jgi:hypothetical protein